MPRSKPQQQQQLDAQVLDAAEQLAEALVAADPTPPRLVDLSIALGRRADELEAAAGALRDQANLLRLTAMEAAGLLAIGAE